MKTWKIAMSMVIAVTALLGMSFGAYAEESEVSSTTLDAQTIQALTDAINDEYRAHAFYAAVIAKFGQVAPFTNIVRSEASHIESLKALFVRYGLPVPPDAFAGTIQAPGTLREAIQAGIDAEIENVAMYDKFNWVTQTDIKTVFTQLRNASQNRHLPAFQRALTRYDVGTTMTPWFAGAQFPGRRWTR